MPQWNLVETGPAAKPTPFPFGFGFSGYGDSLPFQFGANLYMVVEYITAGAPPVQNVQVFSSPDGITWTELDAAHRASGGQTRPNTGYLDTSGATPTLIVCLGNPANNFARTISFDFTTGLWGAYGPDSPVDTTAVAVLANGVAQRPNGDIVILHQNTVLTSNRFAVLSGGVWTDFDSGILGKPQGMVLDPASGTITVLATDSPAVWRVFGIKTDNTATAAISVSAARVGTNPAFYNGLVFGGKVYWSLAPFSDAVPFADVALMSTDSAANPTALSYALVDTAPGGVFQGGLADTAIVYIPQSGGLGVIWDAFKDADPDDALFVTAQSPDGVTWAPPVVYWNVPLGNIWNTPQAGGMQLQGARDFGGAQVALSAWRFSQANGSGGESIWAAAVPNGVPAGTVTSPAGGMGCTPQCVRISRKPACATKGDIMAQLIARGALILSRGFR